MKKQILFLAFFMLAVFAGMNKSYGQENNYLTPATGVDNAAVTSLECGGAYDEIHPQAFVEYTYSVTTAASNTVHWFVVANENNIIVDFNDIAAVTGDNIDDDGLGGGDYIASTTGNGYNNPDIASTSVNITWKPFNGLTQQVLLVAYVVDPSDCSTDNIEIYRILPLFNFTLDVNAILSDGTETGLAESETATECVSPILSAIYTPSATPLTAPGTLVADYGENWVFFTVTAANFTHSWMPTFQITYTGTAEVLTADWAYLADASANTGWNSIDVATGVTTAVLHPATAGTTVGVDEGTGEYIVVRVQVDHGVISENAVDPQNVKMAVNGVMYDQDDDIYTNAALEDIHYADLDATPDGICDDTDGFDHDWVDYVITPRPQIINATGTTPADINFETKADNIDDQGNN